MNSRHLALTLALALVVAVVTACAPQRDVPAVPSPPVAEAQVSGTGRATAEQILEAARTGVIPDHFTPAERKAVNQLR